MIYDWIGRLLFSRQQGWERRKKSKILVLTVAFTLALGLLMATVIRMVYNHQR